jgi:4,5-dihydroxyphthalate decarboxylase
MVLKTALGNYGHTRALKDGTVRPTGVTLQQIEVEPITQAFRMMSRELAFDVCEMALTTHAIARAFNKPFRAIPVVLLRDFHHSAIVYNTRSGIREPSDLAGRKVGVRAYSQTTGVWVRGILRTEFGVDVDRITWVTTEDAHVAEYDDPPNVVRAPPGANLAAMLASGEIDAGIGVGRVDSTDVAPLIPDAREAERRWFEKTGIYPVNHVVVVKQELLATNPGLARELFDAFKASKKLNLERLKSDGPSSPEDELRLRQMQIVGDDPLPYGIAANRRGIETLIQFAFDQKLIPRLFSIEELFDAGILNLE